MASNVPDGYQRRQPPCLVALAWITALAQQLAGKRCDSVKQSPKVITVDVDVSAQTRLVRATLTH